jgi:fructokinase
MKNCNSTWLNGQPLLTDLAQRLGPRVRLANDADCFALSEAQDGAGVGAGLVFGVILGTGVGGGLVFRGDLHAGPNGLAGEWGHTPLPYFRQPVAVRAPVGAGLFQLESGLPDRACYCGRYNCIETFLSGPGLAATHAALWNERCEAPAIAVRADHAALQTLALYREMLARSLAQLVNVLDPDVIVLGGGLSRIAGLDAAVADRVPAYLFSSASTSASDSAAFSRAGTVRISSARWGDDSGVRGAARLWGLD